MISENSRIPHSGVQSITTQKTTPSGFGSIAGFCTHTPKDPPRKVFVSIMEVTLKIVVDMQTEVSTNAIKTMIKTEILIVSMIFMMYIMNISMICLMVMARLAIQVVSTMILNNLGIIKIMRQTQATERLSKTQDKLMTTVCLMTTLNVKII